MVQTGNIWKSTLNMRSAGFLFWVALMLANIPNGSCFPCIHCVAQGEENVCDSIAESAPCDDEVAERYLAIFTRFNDKIDVEKADKTQFKCFKFRMLGAEDYHMKGCTYKNLPICDHMLDGMSCQTCESDNCNGLYASEYHDDDSGNVLSSPPAASIVLGSICVVFVGIVYFLRIH